MTYLYAFLGFAALILLHEFGHFAVAKAVGMRVERFSLFFPPLIARKRIGETEYAIGAVPLGGYVKITGMNPNEELAPEVEGRGYYRQPVWKRVVVILAGPAMNLAIAFILLFCFFYFGAKQVTSVVDRVEPSMPAAGKIDPGDRIVAVDGRKGTIADFRKELQKHRCAGEQKNGCKSQKPAKITLERDGKRRVVSIAPQYDADVQPSGYRLGFTYATAPASFGALGSMRRSIDAMWDVTKRTGEAIARIFDPEQRKQISGVVGSFAVTEQSFGFDIWQAVLVLAIISLSLGVINLFPFLPLDGGHVFFSLVEKIRGKPVPFRVMERASVVGFVLVVGLFVIGLTNDIGRLMGEGFQVR